MLAMAIPTKTLRSSIDESSNLARLWFEDRTQPKSREIFDAKGQLGDHGTGAVYARENAINKMWPLMGYALRSRLAEAK